MSVEAFEKSCDYISQNVDASAFESQRWNNNEGVALEKFVTIMQNLFATRNDLVLSRLVNNNNKAAVGFSLQVWSKHVANINVLVSASEVRLWPSNAEGEPLIMDERPASVVFADISPDSVAKVVAATLVKIRV